MADNQDKESVRAVMKAVAKKNFVYNGKVYKRGESLDVTASQAAELGEFLAGNTSTPAIEDDLVVTSLPPLDGEPLKRGKKNGNV